MARCQKGGTRIGADACRYGAAFPALGTDVRAVFRVQVAPTFHGFSRDVFCAFEDGSLALSDRDLGNNCLGVGFQVP